MKFIQSTLKVLLFIAAISSTITQSFNQDRIIFAILVAPQTETYNKSIWEQANQIIATYNATRSASRDFSMELLDAGLQAASEIRSIVHKNEVNIDSWTLINLDPVEFGQTLNGRPYRYLKFWLAKEDFTDVQWQDLQKRNESLIIYCENSSNEEFDFSYYCSEIKAMFSVLLKR
jgi:hypothetical protein